jgi:hypothetical protein
MPDREKEAAGFPFGGAVVILAILFGYLIIPDQPFKTSRQEMPEAPKSEALKSTAVAARLWEDPFAAVQRSPSYAQKGAPGCIPANLAARIAEKLPQSQGRHLLVLGVMVFGGEYAENAEARRRNRYALISALAEDGYHPADAEQLAYVDFRKPESERQPPEAEPMPVEVMPYEFFSLDAAVPQGNAAAPHVLVLWLTEDRFPPHPFRNLRRLISGIRHSVHGEIKRPPSPGELRFKLLGPAGSTTLKAMVRETAASVVCDTSVDLQEVEMFCWGATADESFLLEEEAGAGLAQVAKRFPLRFYRTIGSDRVVMQAMVAELQDRGVEPKEDHVVLISEWDTPYGRYLPRTFASSAQIPPDSKNIHRFIYLRGIDGQISKDGEKSQAAESFQQDGKKNSRPAGIERPLGSSQVDYLRRLAKELKALDARLAREEAPNGFFSRINPFHQERVKAFGILGSDIYDKLLVLQAIYELFPTAIFFTTDIDARFLHPDELAWTRNLVIASSFGLNLHPALQRSTPPFRDSYQTALFFAARLALSRTRDASDLAAGLEACLGAPRIFEVGRTEAWSLILESEPSKAPPADCGRLTSALNHDATPVASLHPDPKARGQSILPARLAAVAVAVLLFLGVVHRVCRRNWRVGPKTTHRLAVATVTAAVLVTIGALLLLVIYFQEAGGEPLALLEGISIWPTVYLRLAAIVMAVVFMTSIWRSSRKLEDELHDFFESPKPLEPQPPSGALPADGAQGLWEDYCRRTTTGERFKRVLLLGLPYALLCVLIIFAFGMPFVPFRGTESNLSHIVSLILAIVSFIFLLFWVVDATSMAVWFIKKIKDGHGDWSEKMKSREADRFGIDARELNDWIGLKVIVKLTATDNQFIYYPILVIILMWAARMSCFDRYDTPLGLLIVILLGLGFSVSCAIRLRSKAEQFRQEVLARLWEKQVRLTAGGNDSKELSKQIELMIGHIKSIRGGAFVPFLEQPWVRATLIFLTSGGGLTALQYVPWFQ